jgi:hypothetical protein
VFLDGLIELAQGKPHPHAKSRRFGAQYYCHCVLLSSVVGLKQLGFKKVRDSGEGKFF